MRILAFLLLGLLYSCAPTDSSPVEVTHTNPYLLILGTAQDAGYPQAGCQKACCEKVLSGLRAPERVTCVAIVDPRSQQAWMLDATPDFTAQFSQLQLSNMSLAGIFPTHAHIGHYTGLMFVGHEAMGAQNMPVYAMPRMDTFLRTNGPWSQLVSKQNIKLHQLQADRSIPLTEKLSITPFRVPHRDEFSETVGFRVEGPAHTAIYLPDIDKWSRWGRRIDSLVQTVDYALLDATFYDGSELPGRDMAAIPHPFVVESMQRFSSLSERDRARVYFTHFNHTNPLLQEDSEATQAVQDAGYRIARTGMELGL